MYYTGIRGTLGSGIGPRLTGRELAAPLPSSEQASSAVDPAQSDLGPGPTLLHHRGLMLLDCRGRRKVEKAYAVHLAFVWSSVHFQGDRENK